MKVYKIFGKTNLASGEIYLFSIGGDEPQHAIRKAKRKIGLLGIKEITRAEVEMLS